jgi:cytochrome c2
MDGEPGHEAVRVNGIALSADQKKIFLQIDDMKEVMQAGLRYRLLDARGDSVASVLHFTMNHLPSLDLESAGFDPVQAIGDSSPVNPSPAASVVSAERGSRLYRQLGCMACHSTDGTTEGRSGPTFKGLFGSQRTFTDGEQSVADEAYLRQSILEPGARVVEGREVEMPSFVGILANDDIESLIAYIKTLR